jgi:hypothetical protein
MALYTTLLSQADATHHAHGSGEVHQHYRSIVAPIICVLLIPGCLYAAFAMIKNKDEEGNDTDKEAVASI